jgi:hypothetical protein
MGLTALAIILALPAAAQLEENLDHYTGRNAKGYLEPLTDAFGADLSAGFFHTARIPAKGLHIALEIRAMTVFFGDDDKRFLATTENGFRPETTTWAPTVVGSDEAVLVDGDASTVFAFPGGFDVGSFSFATPQIRLGSVYGTEALIRYLVYDRGDVDFGDFNIFGFGVRHSVSQYWGPTLPIDAAVNLYWQTFSMDAERGDQLVDAEIFSVGLHTSKTFGMFEPFAGLSYDRLALDVGFQFENGGETQRLQLFKDTTETLHLTLGLSFNVPFASIYGEYNKARQDAFSIGLTLRNHRM